MNFAAIGLAPLLAALFQATVGLISLRFFHSTSKRRSFIACGFILGLVLAFLTAWALAAPQFGETVLTKLLPCMMVFVPPFTVGYILAHWADSHLPVNLDRGAIPASSEASKRGTSTDAS
jgi:hypothetical protein